MQSSLSKIIFIIIITLFSLSISAEENKVSSDHQYNFYTGNFDFSDDKQSALLVGFQHQNEDLGERYYY